MPLDISSSAFEHHKPIPEKYTEDGEDISPPLSWKGVPDEASSLVLICDDPNAPTPEPWVHWVMYNIPPGASDLPEGVPPNETLDAPAGAVQGRNSFDKIGYGGPAPPAGHGTHHYHFKLYALDTALDANPGLTKQQVLDAMEGHILETGELIGTYER